jgi:hypothetical protein
MRPDEMSKYDDRLRSFTHNSDITGSGRIFPVFIFINSNKIKGLRIIKHLKPDFRKNKNGV